MRNFKEQPRTRRESFEIILKAGEKSRLIPFSFSKDSKYDSLGALLTPEQRAFVREKDVSSVDELHSLVGERNLRAMTGMTLGELGEIVDANDSAYDDDIKGVTPKDYLASIRQLLRNGSGRVGNRWFKL